MPSKRELDKAARDPFFAHEALDRTHLVSTTFYDFIQEHHFVLAHPRLVKRAERVGDELGRLYQEIGLLWGELLEGDEPGRRHPGKRRGRVQSKA